MKGTVIAYCDGGLGNRLNSLIGAVHLATALGVETIVSWPINRWCGLGLEDLFDHSYSSNARSIVEIISSNVSYSLFAHEKQIGKAIAVNPNDSFRLKDILGKARSAIHAEGAIIYYNSILPGYVSEKDAKAIASTLRPKDVYVDMASSWLEQAGLRDGNFFGLHLRGTDACRSRYYYAFWRKIVRLLRTSSIVLCTDDSWIEEYFKDISSVHKRCTIAKPRKAIQNKSWKEAVIDEYGRDFSFNIYRSADSVRDSMVDFIILGRSKILPTSRSTFLENSMRINSRQGAHGIFLEYTRRLIHIYRCSRRLLKQQPKNTRQTCSGFSGFT